MNDPIFASVFIDDPPINATWWWRLQQLAFGFTPPDTGWGRNWRNLESAPRFRLTDIHGLADWIDESGVRGKFTLIPCPAGHGRLDRAVRSYSASELAELLTVVRERIAPRMDLTPEVLTHTMALDTESGALLPHSETAWVSHLAGSGQHDALVRYLRHGYTILRNVGLRPHGLTVGGMSDPSGIANGKLVYQGFHLAPLGRALLSVEQGFDRSVTDSFIWCGAPPLGEAARDRRVPEIRFDDPACGRVFTPYAIDDIAFGTLHGDADLASEIDRLISPDLERGTLVADAEAGKIISFVLHTQTLNSRNTGQGLTLAREVTRRLSQRYGKRLIWRTPSELCAAAP